MSSPKRRTRRGTIIVAGKGIPCPRCGQATQIREHGKLTTRQTERQPYYFTRWFNCTNGKCSTTLVMDERFKVFRDPPADIKPAPPDDIVLAVLDEMKVSDPSSDKPPWEE